MATLSEIKKMLKEMFINFKKEMQNQTEALLKQQEKNVLDIISGNTKIINNRLDKIENILTENISKIKILEKDVADVKLSLNFQENLIDQKVAACHNSFEKELTCLQLLKNQQRNVDDRTRRDNLRIDGLPENDKETWSQTEEKGKIFLEKNLGLLGIDIKRAHRTGIKKDNRSRSIVMKLKSYKDKMKILKETNRLKGSNIYVNEDFSKMTVDIRKKLFAEVKERRLKGENLAVSIICLTETWCQSEDMSNSNLHLTDYKSVHQPRKNGIGGGVCIFIHNSLTYKKVDNLSVNSSNCESLTIEIINQKEKNSFITVLYRPPNGSYNQFENDLRRILTQTSKKHLYLLGDFNLNLINLNTDNHVKNFINTLSQFSAYPMINKPTRVTRKTSSIIDNIITNNYCNSTINSGIIKTDISDHFPVFLTTNTKCCINKKPITVYIRHVNKGSIAIFRQLLREINWELLNDCNDTCSAYDFVIRVFTRQYEKAFPKVQKTIKSRTIKKNFYSGLLQKSFGNAKKTWTIIKEIIGKTKITSSNFPNRLKTDKGEIFNKKTIAERLNNFFINVGKNLAKEISPSSKTFQSFLKKSDFIIDNSELSIEEFRSAFDMLQKNKSAGLDEINTNVLKSVFDIIELPLFIIFKLSLKNGDFPDQLKLAKIIPNYKNGDDSLESNYRPISILSCFSKVLERIMYNRIYNFIDKNNILYPKQFEFRRNHCTEHAVMDFTSNILKGFDGNNYTLGVFVDLSKAFDTVDHEIFLYKLKNYGIQNTNIKWLESYLQNRKQCVTYDLTYTQLEVISCGVPQGSILGPLLFLLYINDIHLSSKFLNFVLFADDTNIFFSGSNLKFVFSTVNTELINLNEWFKANKLSVNIDKTKYILFTKPSKTDNIPLKLPDLFINNIKVKRVHSMKILVTLVIAI
ncbi:uncharacterized protein LOC136096636 [Hydra vulgaris]|uniref:uncharacterized protein LOC136096636 n=1 Tax=Hydra vulgaris TaxID=6087 RepID=UPI0032EA5758